MAKKLVPGKLFNKDHPYPTGKMFYSEMEYNKALQEGWTETPYQAAQNPSESAFFSSGPATTEPVRNFETGRKRPGRPSKKKS